MIGDFDGSTNALWSLYGKEAKSHDEPRIQTLKDDMDGVLIFAGLYSAVLTSFIIDSKQNLKPNPSDQMVYYLQQNVAILSHISQQVSFIAPQFAIPTTPPPPFPTFNPSATDVRVNAFWFMALTFSLSAALLAILVQQWVRDYMHVFQRYGDPLTSARIRQYLYEGSEGWYMPVLAEAVPGLLHVSLFLSFVGLGDFILNINTTVGLTTTVPISISGIFYIFTTFAPVLYPQSPYQNSFSGLIWYIVQKSKLFGRRFKDRDGKSRLVDTDMVRGQLQLAMEETEDRRGRDAQAIRWLVDSLTEDGEMESFAMAIPGSFNGGWSIEVWTKLSKLTEDEMNTAQNELVTGPVMDIPPLAGPPVATQRSPHFRTIPNLFNSIVGLIRIRAQSHSQTNMMALVPPRHPPNIHPSANPTSIHVVHELSKRIAHLFETCKNRGAIASDELWRRRTCACVEATTSLVCYADAELGWFGDILRSLSDIGDFEKTRESSLAGRDQSFVMRWTCLSVMVIRQMLSGNESLKEDARSAIASYTSFRDIDGPGDEVAEMNAREIDEVLKHAWWLVLHRYYEHHGRTTELQRIPNETPLVVTNGKFRIEGDLRSVDSKVSILRERIHQDSYMITRLFAFIQFDLDSVHDHDRYFDSLSDPLKSPFIFPCQLLIMLEKMDWFIHGRMSEFIRQHITDLEWMLSWQEKIGHVLQRQLWRLQDLRDGGGLGFTVELFLLALKQLLSRSLSQDSHSTLYIGTFRVITSDWRKYKHSLGTQKLLLDAVASEQGFVHQYNFPAYITDELLALLEHILEGQAGPHIENAVEQLSRAISRPDDRPGMQDFRTRALRVISRSR